MTTEKNHPPLPESAFNDNIHKIVLSGPLKGAEYTRADILRSGARFQAGLHTAKQVFHHTIAAGKIRDFIDGLFGAAFTQYHAWDSEYEYTARITKKGRLLTSRRAAATPPKREVFSGGGFDRQKNRIIREGMAVPALVDMGVFTKEHRVAASMGGKFAQINRFLELLADETRQLLPGGALNIIDFGCGKSYLTFLMYHYFAEMRGLRVRICGMDTEEALVRRCTETAVKYGYGGLSFIQGEIRKQKKPPLESWGQEDTFGMVVCLHACDTATDHAIYNAVGWGADLICAVPCCQHELRSQMAVNEQHALPLFSRYGIIQERIASLATDAIRAALLEWQGYKTQIIELTDRENTAKNLMIRARKAIPGTTGAAKRQAAALDQAEQRGGVAAGRLDRRHRAQVRRGG
jgi:SAM-dependent methyltransferase